MHYPFKTKPFAHQLKALEAGWKKPEFGYFMEMGTGKTKTVLDNTAMLFDAGKVDAMVVTAPKGVYSNWVDKEIPEHFPSHIEPTTLLWRGDGSIGRKRELNSMLMPQWEFPVLVINIEALAAPSGKAVKYVEKFMLGRKVMFIIDESTTIKSPSAKRTKAVIKLGRLAAYRRILTGSPVTKSPLDLYSQCEFLNPHLLGFSSYYAFRNRYAVMQPQHFGGRTVQQVVGYKNTKELADILKEFTFRVTKDECLDLPPKIYTKRTVELTPEQKKAYEQMRSLALVAFEDGVASTQHALTQLLRLHQIACGHLPLDEGGVAELKNNRLNELMEVLAETEGKVIIWANYRADLAKIEQAVRKAHGGDSIVMYHGDINHENRQQAVKLFQDPDSPVRYFCGNTQTGGYGITLTQASTVIYYSNNYDLEKRLQSEDRAHRIGQTKSVLYVDLVAPKTVDEKIITALRNKENIARTITGDGWRQWI